MQKTTGETTRIKCADEQASDRRSGRCPDLRGKVPPASEQDFQAAQATHTHSTNMERRYSAG
ncbi:MAG TPA: hypothetical protein VFA15_07430, partial [Nitrososphaera sp.]|nr:hypothetical protein [Nitrososphaera sp.]